MITNILVVAASIVPLTLLCRALFTYLHRPCTTSPAPPDPLDDQWSTIEQLFNQPSGLTLSDPTSVETQSLAGQWLLAYLDRDLQQLALISATATPSELLNGMCGVAHVFALIIAARSDEELTARDVVSRDCAFLSRKLLAEDSAT